jgi:glycine C-acetyltransferase
MTIEDSKSTGHSQPDTVSRSGPRPDPLAFLADEVAELKRQNLYRPLRVLSSPQAAEVVVDGKRAINLSSNNYLGLATHPRLVEAAIAATREFGAGSGAVRTIAGTMTLHGRLESDLAAFKRTEAVLTFQSGFTANTGVIPVVTGESDLIVSDALNHASIIDGMRMSKAPRVVYPHKDVAALRELLREARAAGRTDPGAAAGGATGQPHRLILVVTDGVFSMDGDIAPLPGIVDAAEEFGAAVMVDDAHASGVLGRNGRGTVDHFDLHGRVAIQVGTLSKAIGVLGGYVAGSQALRDMLIQRARPFLFSTSHPPAVAASCIAAIQILQEQPELIDRLWANTVYFKSELRRLGFDTGASETPITPVMMGDSATAQKFSTRLFEEGVFAQPVIYPTVALDKARIRTIVTAEHTTAQLDRCLAAFAKVGREVGLIAG